MKYLYPAEKFSDARHLLMLPHPQGEEVSITDAFQECQAKVKDFMDTSGIQASSDKWAVKAKQLTSEEKFELSRIVDELAYWFDRRSEDNNENEA